MKTIFTTFFLTLISMFGIAQNWQAHSVVSQYWPNNDVKSYGGKLYVASNDGLFSSSDNGNTWSHLTAGQTGFTDLAEIVFTNDGAIFARQISYGIVRSLDGGSTWEVDTAGVGSNYGTDLLYYDGVSDKVFLGLGYDKYRLYYQSPSDAGWTEVTNLPAGLNNFSPVQMTRKGDKLFVIDIYKRVLESSDNGISWIQKNGSGLTDAGSQVGPGRFLAIGNNLFLSAGLLWKSTDDGDSWVRIDQGFALSFDLYVDTRCLYYDGTTLYASTHADRMTYKSTDNGTTWTDFGGSGEWFFKAMTMHNGSLFGVIHMKDSLFVLGSGPSSIASHDSKPAIYFYPNPANEHLSILSSFNGNTQFEIFDMQARRIMSSTISLERDIAFKMDLPKIVSGLYFIRLTNEKGEVQQQKIIIE